MKNLLHVLPVFICFLLLTAACRSVSFEPYDYNIADDAKLKKEDYSVRLQSERLQLEKKIPLQK